MTTTTTDAWVGLLLRAQHQDHQRRLAELAALNDLGVRLTAMRDLDALLQEVVTQARRLLDVDVAYLAMAEPDQALTILVTDGSLGPHLRGVRLAPHSGLAGQVADTGEPVSTHDYLADHGLVHAEHADEIAKEEGLRTITGVPLRLRGEVIGVLMTAQRAVQPPTPNDLSLLSSLASLAAVAIENARLFAALEEANEELRRTSDAVNRAVVLHEQLMNIAIRGGGVAQVVAGLSEVVDGDIVFVDAADRAVAAARGGTLLTEPVVPSDDTTTVPVTSGDIFYGTLQVHAHSPVDEGGVRLLERSAMTLALIEAVDRQVAEADRRSTDELLERLISRRLPSDEATRRRALAVGLDVTRPHVVLVLQPHETNTEAARRWARSLVESHGGAVGSVAGLLVAIVGAGCDVHASRSPGEAVGLGGPAVGLAELAAAYDDARACLHALLALGHRHRIAAAGDLGPFRFLLSSAGREDAQRFVSATIGSLLEHDARRGTALVDTMRAYLANGQRHADTARALGIHANTLYQRLSRLDAILGKGWLHGGRRVDIELALRIDQLTL
jgi:GAF domain-containing protein